MSSGVETRAHRRYLKPSLMRRTRAMPIPGLLNDIVVTHILRSENFDDPADLARLPAVSRAMRDAVAAMVIGFAELGMFKRGAAPATGRSPVASRIPL